MNGRTFNGTSHAQLTVAPAPEFCAHVTAHVNPLVPIMVSMSAEQLMETAEYMFELGMYLQKVREDAQKVEQNG